MLSTYLGTESYMAPEILLRQTYSGPAVDLFAAGVILFIWIAGTPPFRKADPQNDPHYKCLCINKMNAFWSAHERGKPTQNGIPFFSEAFRNLMNAMFALDPALRPTISEIKTHEWYNGETVSMEYIKSEFEQRKAVVEAKLEQQKKQKEEEKKKAELEAQKKNVTPNMMIFNGVRTFRCLGAELEMMDDKIKENFDVNIKRTCHQYFSKCNHPERELMIALDPDTAFKYLLVGCQKVLNDFEVSKKTYKVI